MIMQIQRCILVGSSISQSLFIEETKGTEKQYNKLKLSEYYLSDRNVNYILGTMPETIRESLKQ